MKTALLISAAPLVFLILLLIYNRKIEKHINSLKDKK